MRSTATFSLLLFVLLSIWNSQGLSEDARKFGHDGRESVFIFYGPGTPKTRITEQDMKQIVALSPKKLRFDNVVIDRKAKALFSDFSSLEELIMVRTNFDDDDLRSLARCQGLRFANLSDSDVTDDIIPVLAAFQELRTVYLSRTAVTWTAAQELEALRPDMTVWSGYKFGYDGNSVFIPYAPDGPKTRVTERDMKRIVAIDPKQIHFDNVVIDRRAKKLFSAFTSLEEITMVRTNFDDDDLRSLARCQGLRFANLSDSDVTDDIIPVLAAFQELRTVYLSRTAVTWTAAQELEALRPDMTVHIILGRGEFQAEP